MRCHACLRETSRLHDNLCRSCADVQEELGAMWGLPTPITGKFPGALLFSGAIALAVIAWLLDQAAILWILVR